MNHALAFWYCTRINRTRTPMACGGSWIDWVWLTDLMGDGQWALDIKLANGSFVQARIAVIGSNNELRIYS